MNTLYITNTGRVLLDENGKAISQDTNREAIDSVMLLKEATHIEYTKRDQITSIDAKAGDIVITFYENEFPNKIIIVENEQWKENIETYEAKEQEKKEQWAAKNLAECGQCQDDAECANSPSC